VRETIPEICIAVEPNFQGQGIGSRLLEELIQGAMELDGVPGVTCQSVREDNPAVHLYERMGFRRIDGSEQVNRVGVLCFNMVRWFSGDAAVHANCPPSK
jgi:GNAT superfamily N-acetyltransferase